MQPVTGSSLPVNSQISILFLNCILFTFLWLIINLSFPDLPPAQHYKFLTYAEEKWKALEMQDF
jgi:hypothetical protein